MRSTLGFVVVGVVLAVAGGVCWLLGQAERQVAAIHMQLVTLRYADAADGTTSAAALESVRRVPVIGSAMAADARAVQGAAGYWLGHYDALKPARDAAGAPVDRDPQSLLLAANAAFRVARESTADRAATLKELDEVIKSYGEVLRTGPGSGDVAADAAYNFEFVVRTREQLIRQRGTAGLPKPDDSDGPPTLHGHPGGPPRGVSMSEFKVVIPKRSEERQENPDAGKGTAKQRKG